MPVLFETEFAIKGSEKKQPAGLVKSKPEHLYI